MTKIELPANTKGAVLLTYGDADANGKLGVKAQVFADLPFDGEAKVTRVIDLPEIDSVPVDKLPAVLASLSGALVAVLSPITSGIDAVKRLIGGK